MTSSLACYWHKANRNYLLPILPWAAVPKYKYLARFVTFTVAPQWLAFVLASPQNARHKEAIRLLG